VSVTAVILARGGSKGLARKNVVDVAGRPCVAWTIEAAQRSASIERVVLSTDDPEIREVGMHMGARIHDRGPTLASDIAPVDEAVRSAVWGDDAGVVVILYGNVPVRPPDLMDRAVRRLVERGADSVQSFARVGKHHPTWTVRIDLSDGELAPWEGDTLFGGVHRRQDLEAAFVPDGGVMAVARPALELCVPGAIPGPHAFLGRDRRGIATEPGDVVDIDSEIDRRVADAVLRERLGRGNTVATEAA